MSDPPISGEGGRPLHRSGEATRAPIVAGLAAPLIIGGLIDRAPWPGPPVGGRVGPTGPGPGGGAGPGPLLLVVLRRGDRHPRRLGATSDGLAPGAVVIANSGSAAGVGGRHPRSQPGVPRCAFRCPSANSRQVIAEDVPAGAPWIGAIVDIDAGAVAVDQQVNGPLGGRPHPAPPPARPTGTSRPEPRSSTPASGCRSSIPTRPTPSSTCPSRPIRASRRPSSSRAWSSRPDGLRRGQPGGPPAPPPLHRHHRDGPIGAPGGLEDRRRHAPHEG